MRPRLVIVDLNARANPLEAADVARAPAARRFRWWPFSPTCKWISPRALRAAGIPGGDAAVEIHPEPGNHTVARPIPTFMKLRRVCLSLVMLTFLAPLFPGSEPRARDSRERYPATALSAALSAACRADPSQFENYLTVESAAAFRTLPEEQRGAFMRRFSLTDEAGKALGQTGPAESARGSLQAPGGTSEFRFGDERVHDNLAFIRVDVVDSEDTSFRDGPRRRRVAAAFARSGDAGRAAAGPAMGGRGPRIARRKHRD